MHRYDIKTRKSDVPLSGVNNFQMSFGGEKALYRQGQNWFIAALRPMPTGPGGGARPAATLPWSVDEHPQQFFVHWEVVSKNWKGDVVVTVHQEEGPLARGLNLAFTRAGAKFQIVGDPSLDKQTVRILIAPKKY